MSVTVTVTVIVSVTLSVTVTVTVVGGSATHQTAICIGNLKMALGLMILKNLGVLGINSRMDSSSGALPNQLQKNNIANNVRDNRAGKPIFFSDWNTSFL